MDLRDISFRPIAIALIATALLFTMSGCTGGGGGGDSAGYYFDGSNLEGTGAGKTLTIEGTLLSSDGHPIANAQVTAPEGEATITDQDGRFNLLANESSVASLTFVTGETELTLPLGSTVDLATLSFTATIKGKKEITANNIKVVPDSSESPTPSAPENSNFTPQDGASSSEPSPDPTSQSTPAGTATPEPSLPTPPTNVCGDGILDPGEECDDGNLVRADGCGPACRLEKCGNGILNQYEQCDDGNAEPGDGCSPGCKLE